MRPISAPLPAQIRGARAMLGWSLRDLAAAARLSVAAVKRIEDGTSEASLGRARAALELKGIESLSDGAGGSGVRLPARAGAVSLTPGLGRIAPPA